MKRTALAVLSLAIATSVFGAETKRYLVATTAPVRSGGLAVAVNRAPVAVEPRNVDRFAIVDGFAADLTEADVAALRQSPGVRWVEPVVSRYASDLPRVLGQQTTPYGVTMLRAPLAWTPHAVGDVNVVVVDTGVDYRHPELAALWRGGFDFVNNDDDAMDDNGHGTHVSGTIVAHDDEDGVVGVAPGMKLYGLKVLSASGQGSSANLIRALDWVVARRNLEGGRWVVNLSLGSAETSDIEREAFARAAGAGIIVVAASGNSSTSAAPAPVQYPAAYPGVLAVGAIDSTRRLGNFSCQGPELDFVAPGIEVLSTVRVGTDDVSFLTNGTATIPALAIEGSKRGTITGEYVFCGLGKEGEITPEQVGGKIALIRRGEITFAEKARRAKEAGAIAVAIVNNDDIYRRFTMLIQTDPSTLTYDWPLTVAIRKPEGEALIAQGGGTITIASINDDYGEKSGTSMASPHIAGAAAFLWSLAPNATAAQIVNAMHTTAVDLGPAGQDPAYGAGVVDLLRAAKMLAPHAYTKSRRRSAGH